MLSRARRQPLALFALLTLATVAAAGCEVLHDCKPNTLLLSLSLYGAPDAERLRVTLTLAGDAPRQHELARSASGGVEAVEITFPSGYVAGRGATVLVEALAGGAVVARVESEFVLVNGCSRLGLALGPAAGDDAAAPPDQLAATDLTPPPPPPPDQCVPLKQCPASVVCGQAPDGCGGTLTCAPCQLLALNPPLAAAGSTVALEGTFNDPAVVQFPGGVAAPATVLGRHHATVVVPAGATAGDLSVATGGVTVGPLRFRRAPFAFGVGPFYAEDEQTNGARQLPQLNHRRSGHSTAVVGSSLFVIGGSRDGASILPIERATINADGTLSSFKDLTAVAPVNPRYLGSSVVIGSTIYLVGGDLSGGGTVERARVDANGALSQLELLSSRLTVPRQQPTSIVIGDSIYVIGGSALGAPQAVVERATILPDGTLSSFARVADLSVARYAPFCFVRGQVLYVVGGDDQNGSIESAPIHGDGSLGDSTQLTQHLDRARVGFSGVALGDAVYLFGGNGTGAQALNNGVERAVFDSNGVLSDFHVMPGIHLRAGRTSSRPELIGNYVYVISGLDTSKPIGTPAQNPGIERASINASGALSSFSQVPDVIKNFELRSGPRAVVAGRSVYVIGGQSDSPVADVLGGTFSADGSLSSLAPVADVTVKVRRSLACTAIVGRSLYLIGGLLDYNKSDSAISSVERASIADDGTLSPFDFVPGRELTKPRSAHSCVVHGRFLYVIGGDADDNNYTIDRAAIGPDDQLGPFAVMANAAVPFDSGFAVTPAVLGDSLYLVGNDSLDAANGVQRATFLANGDLSAFSVPGGVTVMQGRSGHCSLVVGRQLMVFDGLALGQTAEGALINADDSLAPFAYLDFLPLVTWDANAIAVDDAVYFFDFPRVTRGYLQ
jgi:hypothetical protein